MACYGCGGEQGSAARLCPDCIQKKRANQELKLSDLENSRLAATPEVKFRLVEPGEERSPYQNAVCVLMFLDILRGAYRIANGHPLLASATNENLALVIGIQEGIAMVATGVVLYGAVRQERWALWAYAGFFLFMILFSIIVFVLGGVTKLFVLSVLWPAAILIALVAGYVRI